MCSLHDAVELAARGVPMVTLCMEPYMGAAAAPARVYGLLDARLMAVQHPLAALAPKEVMQRADAVVERRMKQLMTAH